MEHGNLCSRGRKPALEGSFHKRRPAQQNRKENNGTEGVEHEMDKARPPGIGSCRKGGHQRSHARTDIGPQNDIENLIAPCSDRQPCHRHGYNNGSSCRT